MYTRANTHEQASSSCICSCYTQFLHMFLLTLSHTALAFPCHMLIRIGGTLFAKTSLYTLLSKNLCLQGRGSRSRSFTGKNSLHTKQTFGCSHHTRYPQTELYRISCCSIEKTTGQTKIADSFLNLNVTCTKIGWLCLLTVGATKCCFKCIKIRVKAVGRFGSLGSTLRHACIPILCIYVNICVWFYAVKNINMCIYI